MNAVDEVYNYEYALANARKLLSESAVISAQDKQLIAQFIRHLSVQGVSTGRLAKYLNHVRKVVEHLQVDVQGTRRADIETVVAWLGTSGYSPLTVADYILVIKRFFKFARYGKVDRDTPWPEEVKWLKKTLKQNEKKEPLFLTSEEAESMIKAATCFRDKAMLAVGFEVGLRATELLTLNVEDVQFDDRGARLHIEKGKTGARTIRLISSVTHLSRYLEIHPLRNSPTAPLWLTESTNYRHQRLSWVRWNRRLKQIAREADVSKPRIFNHMLRHGSARRNARFLSDSELKVMYGWSMGSRMPAIYVHLSGKDLDEKLIALYSGKPVEPVKPSFSPVICPRCMEHVSPGMLYCPKCATPLDPKERSKVVLEDQTTRNELVEVRKMVEKYLPQASSKG